MKITLIQLQEFVSRWNSLRLTDDDLISLEQLLNDDPEAGVVIPGTGGLRKIRFAPPSSHSGKRGATRVCYALIVKEFVYLFTIFAKNEQGDISPQKKQEYRELLDELKEYHE